MNSACDIGRIPRIEKIRRHLISIDTDHGTFEVDMPNIHDNAVSLEQYIQSNVRSPFDILISQLICRPVNYTLKYHPSMQELEEYDDTVIVINSELDEFLSEFRRSDKDAAETQ